MHLRHPPVLCVLSVLDPAVGFLVLVQVPGARARARRVDDGSPAEPW